MTSIFSKIISREIPSYIIAENEMFIAFLDVFPLSIGHVLVVAKIEIDKFYDLPADYLMNIMVFAKPICEAIEKSVSCKRVGMAIIGLEIPHAHLHLVPLVTDASDINFAKTKLNIDETALKEMQLKLIANLQ